MIVYSNDDTTKIYIIHFLFTNEMCSTKTNLSAFVTYVHIRLAERPCYTIQMYLVYQKVTEGSYFEFVQADVNLQLLQIPASWFLARTNLKVHKYKTG